MLELIYATLGIVVLACTIIGLAARFVLLPWLRSELVEPVQETHKQVTENHHSNTVPTVLDRIEDVHTETSRGANLAGRAVELAEEAVDKVDTLGRMFDGHLEWSQAQVDRMDRRFAAREKRKES